MECGGAGARPRAAPSQMRAGQKASARKFNLRGTVNLIGSGRDKAHQGRSHEGLCPSRHAGDLGPGLKGLGSGGSILAGRAVIAAEEEVGNLIVSGEEALGLARRLEPLHLPLSPSRRLIGVFGPVVAAFMP